MTKIDILWETIGKLCKTQSWQVSQGRFPTFMRDTESAVHIYQFPRTEFKSSSTWRFMAADRNLICTSLYLYLYCCFLQNIVLSSGALVTAFCMYNCGWYRVFFLNCSAQILVLKRKMPKIDTPDALDDEMTSLLNTLWTHSEDTLKTLWRHPEYALKTL